MEGVPDFDTIDIELDEDLEKKQSKKCVDAFLNSLSLEELEDLEIPDYANVEAEEEAIDDTLEDENGEDEEEIMGASYTDSNSEEEEGDQFKYATHDPTVKWNKMRPHLGERYESPQQLKLCITNRAIAKGYQVRFEKCDSVRLYAVCGSDKEKFNCPYYVRASWMSIERSFQVKKIHSKHKCVRNFKNGKLMGPTWLARQFLKELIRKPDLKGKEIQAIVQNKFHCKISWVRSYRAKLRALSLIEGNLSDHYARVWEYGGKLMRSNPGSTVRIGVRANEDDTTTFKRMYICFKSIKEGWKSGCRRVIGLDGSFLKGHCKGELLTAIGRDPNNQVYPISWAVVEVESKVNWGWFMELLDKDLDLQGGRDMCIISDQHKGLLEAAKVVLPLVEHRQCARHIYANFRKGYSGIEYRNMFWAAAKSTTEAEFNGNMELIKEISAGAYKHLKERNPNSWCRAFFSHDLACEAVENGMAECFNAVIIDARKRPLLTMLEEIRLYIMDRFYNLRQLAEKWEGVVCPSAIKKMNKFGEHVKFWYVHPSGLTVFEVRHGLQSFGVDLEKKSCTCNLWQIFGIPCVHAQASIMYTQQDPSTFISPWFSKEKYLATYSSNIQPFNGSNLWKKAPYKKPLPPTERRLPGRPSVKRKRHASEHEDKFSQVSSKGITVQCHNCQQKGHNKKGCPNPTVIPDPKPKKKMGRPRLDPNLTHRNRGVRGRKRGGVTGAGASTRGGGASNRGGGGGEYDDVHKYDDDEEALFDVKIDEETTKMNVEVQDEVHDDGDGLDMANVDEIVPVIYDLRTSKYDDATIMDYLHISKEQLKEFGAMIPPSAMVPPRSPTPPFEEEHVQVMEKNREPVEEQVEDHVVDLVVEGPPIRQPTMRTRRPSERINLKKLARRVVDPAGIGMSSDKPLSLQ